MSFTFCDEGVHACRGFAAGFGFGLLLTVISFVAEECIVACVMVVVFSLADFKIFRVAAVVPLGQVFAELKVEDIFLEVAMSIC